jgi:hypothetical protein
VVSLVVIAIVVTFAVTDRVAADRADSPAATQAAGIDALLTASSAGRLHLLSAIDDIQTCDVTAATTANIRYAETSRFALLARIDNATVSDLPTGNMIKSELYAATQASYVADKAYLMWVEAAGNRCPSENDKAFASVRTANAKADAIKTRFVNAWNSVAKRYQLGRRSVKDI